MLTILLCPRSQPRQERADQTILRTGHVRHPQASRGAAPLAADEPQVAQKPLELCMDFMPLLAFVSAAHDIASSQCPPRVLSVPCLRHFLAISSPFPHRFPFWLRTVSPPFRQILLLTVSPPFTVSPFGETVGKRQNEENGETGGKRHAVSPANQA